MLDMAIPFQRNQSCDELKRSLYSQKTLSQTSVSILLQIYKNAELLRLPFSLGEKLVMSQAS